MSLLLAALLAAGCDDSKDLPDPPTDDSAAVDEGDDSGDDGAGDSGAGDSGDDGAGDSGGDDSGSGDGGGDTGFVCPESPEPPALSEDGWTLAGPVPGGDFVMFDEASEDPGRLFAGSSINGIYVSADGGSDWTPLDVLITHVYGQLDVNARDADKLVYTSGSLWLTTDGGESFDEIVGLADDPATGSIYGAAWDGDDLLYMTSGGQLYRSEDLGQTFTALGQVDYATDTAPPPHSPIISQRYWALAVGDGVIYTVFADNKIWRSTDGGLSFEELRDGVGVHAYYSLKARGDEVWVADQGQVLHSSDKGESFEVVGEIPGVVFSLEVGPDGRLSAVTEDALWLQGEDGAWSEITVGEAPYPAASWRVDDETVLLGHAGGILRSADDGATWAVTEGPVDTDLSAILSHPQCPGLTWVGTRCQGGLYRTEDFGDSYQRVDPYTHYVMHILASPHDPNEIWVSSDDHVFRSRDLGESWEQVNPESIDVHLHGLAVDPHNRGTALMGSVGSGEFADTAGWVYRSDDDGATWFWSSEGIPASEASMHTIHFSLTDPGVVLVGSFRGGTVTHNGDPGIGMFRSEDNGNTWEQVELDILDVAFITECDGRTYAATDGGLLWSDDAGASWTAALTAEDEFLAVACHGDVVLALDGTGDIHRSDDRGGSWVDWGMELETELRGNETYRSYELEISSDGARALLAYPRLGFLMRPL